MPLQGIWHIWHGDMFMRLAENFGVECGGRVLERLRELIAGGVCSTSYMLHLLLLLG